MLLDVCGLHLFLIDVFPLPRQAPHRGIALFGFALSVPLEVIAVEVTKP